MHYQEQLEYQPEFIEQVGKFYPPVKEELELKLLRFDNNQEANEAKQ